MLVEGGYPGAQPGIELEGGTYRYFEGADATPAGCQAACRAEGQCLAWDYVRPGIYGQRCTLFSEKQRFQSGWQSLLHRRFRAADAG